jgi:branched-chain amino acid transport system ATP-binding protein
MTEPRLLILDEPTAGLSPSRAKQVYSEISAFNRRSNVTILLVDQNVREALALANYVYVLEMGRNQSEGRSDTILGQLDRIVQRWMGYTMPAPA